MSNPVTLHIYHVSTNATVGTVNEYLEAIGTGAFHAGVEVKGVEYSYGYAPDRTGVFTCAPKGCKAHVYKESLDMGATSKTDSEIDEIIEEMKERCIAPAFVELLSEYHAASVQELFSVRSAQQMSTGSEGDVDVSRNHGHCSRKTGLALSTTSCGVTAACSAKHSWRSWEWAPSPLGPLGLRCP